MTSEEFNQIAWRDFILWAIRQPDIVATFTRRTGVAFEAPPRQREPIEQLVDLATGRIRGCADNKALEMFVEWITREHWGIDHAPAAYRTSLARRA